MTRLTHFVISLILVAATGWLCQAGVCGPEPELSISQHRLLYEAQELFQKKRYAQAWQMLAGYPADNKNDHHRLAFLRGMLAYQTAKLAEAEKAFAAAVKLWPCFGPAWRNLVAVQFERKRPLAAAESAQQAYKLVKPPDPELLYQAAVFYLNAGRPAPAVRLLEGLAKAAKAKETWLKALVNAYLENRQPAKAEPVIARLLTMTPADPWLWRLQADLALRKEKYAQAASALDLAVRLGGAQPGDWRNLSELYLAAGAPLKAAEFYRRQFGPRLKPENLRRLAEIYRLAGSLAKSLEAAQKAALMEPSAANLALLGDICLRTRDYRKASSAYERAAAASQGKEVGRYLLRAGQSAFQVDLLDRAGALFVQALKQGGADHELKKEAHRQLEGVRQLIAYFASRETF